MGWPLTGNNLSRFNRLLDDLRQYGDFPLVGSPDDITWLWQIIREVSDGQFSPELDDVANRSHYWMLRLVAFLGDRVVPPTPPAQTGLQWGDTTILKATNDHVYLDRQFPADGQSIVYPDLKTITDELNGFDVTLDSIHTDFSISIPSLENLDVNSMTANSVGIISWSTPRLSNVRGALLLYDNPFVFLDLSGLETVGQLDVIDLVPLSTFSWTSLRLAGQDGSTYFAAYQCSNLVSLLHPVLEEAGGDLIVLDCDVLPELSFPALTTIGGNVSFTDCAILAVLSFPVWLPTNGTNLTFTNNALNAASVNHILARAVANPGYVSGTIDLSGQTPAQPPTGQGIADAATLSGRGVTVVTD